MHPFRSYISQYTTLTLEEWLAVEDVLNKTTYEKRALLLQAGQICNKLYFLEDGFLRFYILREGNELTKFFTKPPYCFTSQRSFTQETASIDYIEALKDSTVWEMNKSDAFKLLEYSGWSEFVRKLVQEVQFYTEQILEETQSSTAEERYIKMIEENDIILQEAPLKYIASYLGIAPQSLSRIRKKYYESSRGN